MAIQLPPQAVLSDRIGGRDDNVILSIDGQEIGLYHSYDVQMSVLQQPAAFSLRLGWSDTAAALLDVAAPGKTFELLVAGVVVQSGRIDARELQGSSAGTFVEVRGRDWMAAVYDSFVQEERSFANATYFDLTRKILDICGLQDRGLIAGEDLVFKKAVTGTTTIQVVNEESIKQIETGVGAGTTTKVVNKTLKAKLGERWFDWLQRQYKLVGLFLWCTGEGNFVLSTPEWDQLPAYTILKSRGAPGENREFATVLSSTWKDDCSQRYSEIVVHGRAGGGKAGRGRVTGRYVDQEMVARGIVKQLVVHDQDCKTPSEAEFVALRTAAEQRRAGWQLQYTVAGHTMPSLTGGGLAIFNPNTTVRVVDDEIPIDGILYLEAVGFHRGLQTTTTLTLMRSDDLIFAKPELKNKKAPKLRKAPKG